MGKSMLVIDTPENCNYCPCFCDELCSCTAQKYKRITAEDWVTQKPEWCPLKEVSDE